MLLPGENSPKTWLFVTILLSTIIAISESSGGKTLNIKLGFDLIQGSNGAPSLRIRDFKDSAEFNPRALDEGNDGGKKKITPKSDSSDSDDSSRSKKEESKEPAKPLKSSNEHGGGGGGDDNEEDNGSNSRDDKIKITRSLKAGDFEPEEDNPKIHGKYQKNYDDSDNNSNEDRRRSNRRQYINTQ